MWIDSHAHMGAVDENKRAGVLQRAYSAGVTRIINICTNEKDLKVGLALKKEEEKKLPGYAQIFNAAATTPHDVLEQEKSAFSAFEKAARSKELVALGETGLDYFYERSPIEAQKKEFLRYIELALETKLPLIIHCRDAFKDFFEIIKSEYASSDRKGVLHCFTGTLGEAKTLVDMGWMISLSGILTFKNAQSLREVAQAIPLDHLLVETDAPWLAPQSHRGKENEPGFVVEVGQMVADVKDIPLEKVARVTAHNCEALFSLPA